MTGAMATPVSIEAAVLAPSSRRLIDESLPRLQDFTKQGGVVPGVWQGGQVAPAHLLREPAVGLLRHPVPFCDRELFVERDDCHRA